MPTQPLAARWLSSGDALLALVADDPAAAVDLEDAGALVARLRVGGLDDVEAQLDRLALLGDALAEDDVACVTRHAGRGAIRNGRTTWVRGNGDGEWSGSSSIARLASSRCSVVLPGLAR